MFVLLHLSTSIIYQFECNGDSVVRTYYGRTSANLLRDPAIAEGE